MSMSRSAVGSGFPKIKILKTNPCPMVTRTEELGRFLRLVRSLGLHFLVHVIVYLMRPFHAASSEDRTDRRPDGTSGLHED